jgi:thiamine-phosphate pyrophosphorylase
VNKPFYQLMLVTHRQNSQVPEYLSWILHCVQSKKISVVQLREKNATPEDLLAFALQLKKILSPHNIPLIINDNLELALEIDADGIHLGQSDGSPDIARAALGPDKIIGLSIETTEELYKANEYELDYVAASSVFPSRHKQNVRTHWGIDGLKKLVAQSRHPVIGIGGITLDNLKEVMSTGAHGVAVIGALHDAVLPVETAYLMREIIRNSIHDKSN